MRVVFFGTPEVARETLSFLYNEGVEIVGVVTKPDRPKGRFGKVSPPPVKDWVLKNGAHIPLIQPEKASKKEVEGVIDSWKPDLFVVIAYGEILSSSLLSKAPLGGINLHASLLPRWRGAAPVQRAIMAGDRETGVSIIRLVDKMDAGPVLLRKTIPLDDTIRSLEVLEQVATEGKKLLLEAIKLLERGVVEEEIQDERFVTYAPKLTASECLIDWEGRAEDLHNLVRGAYPNPIASCLIDLKGESKWLNLHRTRVRSDVCLKPREIIRTKKELIFGTGHQGLEILELQQEGKKVLKVSDWLIGIQGPFHLK